MQRFGRYDARDETDSQYRSLRSLMTPLQYLPAGTFGRVTELLGDVQCVQRLEELGLARGVLIEMVSSGSPCIVRVNGTRLCFRSSDLLGVLVTREEAA